ncbi:sialate O-acetylesterase [Schlesneria sp.]|uniref:sialate O-acetylesterase n=1 Tax=Schlesneria sp. TaxID=2762018 RepID=UPI002EDD8140
MSSRCIAVISAIALIAVTTSARADIKLPGIFSDHMVLQTGKEVPFWGWAEPGEEVTVTITSKDPGDTTKPESANVVTAADGRWSLRLPGRSKPAQVEVTVTGKNTVTLTNVLFGDVWICSGQSNMEWPVSASLNHQEEIAEAKFPSIRFFKAERSTARVPQDDNDGKWVECSPDSIGGMSAVAYFFGRELHQRLKRPIGLVQLTHGGSICEAWTSQAALKSDEDFAKILERAERASTDPSQANNPNRASVLYNGMIAPIQGYGIKGAIWYQGESNTGRAFQYRKLFPLLISNWRRQWGLGDFPFLFVQLPNYVPEKSKPDRPDEPEESAWAELREAQLMSLSVPRTGMAVTIDVGEPRDIHPRNKQVVGKRLALAALQVAYGQDIVASGPRYKSMKVMESTIELEFQDIGDGLVAQGGDLRGFAIAGADKKFVWATARIEGNVVRVSSSEVPAPVAVRYAWGDNPDGNLFNGAGLPASPFRTDDWAGITHQNR